MLRTFFLVSTAIATLTFISAFSNIYKPVDELDLSLYMGRWYQVYKNRFDMTFQGKGTCAVADYNLSTNNVTVLNSQIDNDNTVDQIAGYAFYQPNNHGGELTVVLEGTPRPAPYWVIEIGPIINDEYQYSIISDNNKISLFVLARNVTDFYNKYNNNVEEILANYGFTNELNKPIIMSQFNCNYDRYKQ
jgi:lipocalin